MCGIICFNSSKDIPIDKLNNLLYSIRHRGPDHEHISSFELPNNNKIIFLVTQLIIVGNELFPIEFSTNTNKSFNNPVFYLIGNLEIYNYKEIYNKYLQNIMPWHETYSDAHIILPLIQKFLTENYSLEDTIKNLFEIIKGDYALLVFLSKSKLLVARDPVGIRPLYYVYKSNLDFAFSSESTPLLELGFTHNDIQIVTPGTYSIIDTLKENNSINWNFMKKALEKLVDKRNLVFSENIPNIEAITKQIYNQIATSVQIRIPTNNFALFLSGGIDSSIILALLLKFSKKSYMKIISVGFPESPDLIISRKLCKILDIDLFEVIIDQSKIIEALPSIISILKTKSPELNPLDVSIALPLYFASKKAKELGLKVAFSGQGADEVFIGYKKYFEHELTTSKAKLIQLINYDLINLALQNLERDDLITMHSSIEIRFPYLDIDVLTLIFQQNIEILYSGNDLIRKDILRKVARMLDLPTFIVERKKKAAQYGSLIMKNLILLAKSHSSLKNYLESF
jgi:asparagine synthase (glutamine-hydrolysing)